MNRIHTGKQIHQSLEGFVSGGGHFGIAVGLISQTNAALLENIQLVLKNCKA